MCTDERQEGEGCVRTNLDECASESGCGRTDRAIVMLKPVVRRLREQRGRLLLSGGKEFRCP